MPSASKRACAGGCGALVDFGRCAACKGQKRQGQEAQRLSSSERGYTQRWRRYSVAWRERHPFCGERANGELSREHSFCAAEGRATQAAVVDHVVPVRDRSDPLFWDTSNHQSLCAACHNRKTATEDGGFLRRLAGERIVVTGPPGVGKTTWVAQRARRGDLVWDLDALAALVAQVPEHPRPLDAMRALLAMRDGFLHWLQDAHVNVHTFVIVTDEDEARQIAARIGARVVKPR